MQVQNYYLDNDKTETLFKKLKILPINKLSLIKIYANKKDYETSNIIQEMNVIIILNVILP